MKKIIDSKRYDTETAEEVASWWNGCSRNDFKFCSETIYQTKNKAWFLHAEGGPLSKYARPAEGGNAKISGEDIFPMTEQQAADWLAENDTTVFEKYFSHLAKDA